MADPANVPIPTANDINKINALNEIGQSNIYGIDTDSNAKQPVIDAATERLLVETALQSALNGSDYLNVEIQEDNSGGEGASTVNIDEFGGQAQSAIDVAAKIDALTTALASNAGDTLQISAPSTLDVSTGLTAALNGNNQLDVSLANNAVSPLTITDNGSFSVNATPLDAALNGSSQLDVDLAANSAGTIPTEQQSPVGVEDSQGTQIDPLARQDTSPITASTTAAATYVTLTLGDYRKDVDFFVDTSGAATLTVEIRTSGGTWRTLDTIDYSSATTEVEQYNTAFAEIRASLDANVNVLEASSKGV